MLTSVNGFDILYSRGKEMENNIELAMQLTIMDAMEKGHTNKDELILYMESETFKSSVKNYLSTMDDIK